MLSELTLAIASLQLGCANAGSLADAAKSSPVFDIVMEHLKSPSKLQPAESIRPGPPGQVFLSYADCDFDYRCYCQNRVSFRLQPVDAQRASALRSELEHLAQSPMFGCHETGMDMQGRRETRCRFVRYIKITRSDLTRTDVSIPPDAGPNLGVWIECAVRVDSKGLPLEEAASRAAPILVEGDMKKYEVIEEFKSAGAECSMDVHFAGKVFDLRSCKQDSACLGKALDAYTSSLRHEFSQAPLSASEIHDQPIPPGEIWMRRAYQQSEILGLPYFELSTYVFKIWFTAYDHGDFSLEPRQDLHSLYLNVSESLTRSVGVSGTYTEPSQEQIAAYRAATNAALSRALVAACRKIGGQMHDAECQF